MCVEGGEKFFGFSTPQDSSKPDGIKVFEDGRCATIASPVRADQLQFA